MRVRAIVVVVIPIAIAVTVWRWTTRANEFPAPTMPPTRSETAAQLPVVPATAPVSAPGAIRAVAAAAHAPETGTAESPTGASNGIDGRIVVVGRNGVDYTPATGSFVPRLQFATQHDVAPPFDGTAAVTNGRFHIDAENVTRVGAMGVVLDGRRASVRKSVACVNGATPLLHARFVESIRLHVRDIVTGTDLDDVTVGHSHDWMRQCLSHPVALAANEVIVDHAPSPVELAPTLDDEVDGTERFFWVTARDHAWRRIQLAFDGDVDPSVDLPRASSLVVDVAGELPHKSAAEAARDNQPLVPAGSMSTLVGGAPVPDEATEHSLEEPDALLRIGSLPPDPWGGPPTLFEAAAVLGPTRIDGLPPGDVDVSVVVDVDPPRIAGHVRTTLVAGEQQHVVLHLEHVEAATEVTISGRLVLPASWGREGVAIEIERLAPHLGSDPSAGEIELPAMTPSSGRDGHYVWQSPPLAPGWYRLSVNPTGVAALVELGPNGLRDVELVVGEAATIRVRFVDEQSGQSVHVERANWSAASDPAVARDRVARELISLRAESDGVTFASRVPVGRARFRFLSKEWMLAGDEGTFDVRGGEQEIVVPVRRTQGITLRLRVDGSPAYAPDGNVIDQRWLLKIDMTPLGGSGRKWTTWIEGGATTTLFVTTSGRYRITLPKLPGYAPVPSFDVDLAAGEIVEREVELTRE